MAELKEIASLGQIQTAAKGFEEPPMPFPLHDCCRESGPKQL